MDVLLQWSQGMRYCAFPSLLPCAPSVSQAMLWPGHSEGRHCKVGTVFGLISSILLPLHPSCVNPSISSLGANPCSTHSDDTSGMPAAHCVAGCGELPVMVAVSGQGSV